MPSKSPKQAHMMQAAAHDPAFAKKVGVSQDVAREFNQADMNKNAVYGAKMDMPMRKHGNMKR